MPEPIILLRLFVEVDSRAEAEAEVPRITSHLERFGTVETRKVEQYYKIEEYWEIALGLHPAGPPLEAYEELIGMAAAGWEIGKVVDEQEDRWAVWNAESGAEFLAPRVVWASVDLLPFGINRADDDVEYLDVDAPIR
jgi:hypothetical protein